jgi:pilus assembly protein CpaB
VIKRTIVLVVALVLAGVAAFSVWQYLESRDEAAREGQARVTVFRARDDIPAKTPGNTIIDGRLFEQSEELIEFLPVGANDRTRAFSTEEQLVDRARDRFTIGPISKNQILTTDQFEDPQDVLPVKTVSEIISPGKQAISIQLDSTRAVGGFIRPNDRINVIVTIRAPVVEFDQVGGEEVTEESLREVLDQLAEAQTQEFTRFLLQGIPVLAVGAQKVTGDPVLDNAVGQAVAVENTDGTVTQQGEGTQFGILTVEVTPEEAERLVFADEKGSLWLTLVPKDFSPVPTEGINRETLFE